MLSNLFGVSFNLDLNVNDVDEFFYWKAIENVQILEFFLYVFSKNDRQFDHNFYVVIFHYDMGRIQKNNQKM